MGVAPHVFAWEGLQEPFTMHKKRYKAQQGTGQPKHGPMSTCKEKADHNNGGGEQRARARTIVTAAIMFPGPGLPQAEPEAHPREHDDVNREGYR